MNIKEFTSYAAEEVLNCFPEEVREKVRVETAEVMKVNDQVMHGLTFHNGEDSAPTYYMEDFFHMYQCGADMSDLFREIARVYDDNMRSGPQPVEVPDLEFSKVRRKTGLRLLHEKYNRQFLKTVPYREVGNGYVLICEVQIKASDGGIFSTVITKSMAENYDYDMDALFAAALENAWRNNSATLIPAGDILGGPDAFDGEDSRGENDCYILTSERPRFGAAALFYPGTQAMIAHVLKEDYIAIPSSLHEFIILRKSRAAEPEIIQQMVLEANRIVVGPDEILSDCVLQYSVSEGRLSAFDRAGSDLCLA